MMGLESDKNSSDCGVDNKDEKKRVLIEDIIMSLKGHVKESYNFNPSAPFTDDSPYYNANPSLNDKMHCLLCVVEADTLSMMSKELIKKIRTVRTEASRLGIPLAVLLTKVDRACKLTQRSLQNVYKSKRISDKIKECSINLTVPENCIFPVQNYHNETDMNNDINCLMLNALTQIVRWANDYVERSSNKQTLEFRNPWRKENWRDESKEMASDLLKLRIFNNDVKDLRVLLYGPVGAGKSSIINTIKSIFAGRQYVNCLAAAESSKSQTLCFEKFVISKTHGELLPFAFFDVTGSECGLGNKDEKNDVHINDIIKALKGHVKECYRFKPSAPLTDDSLYYNANPSLNDKMHCLLCVVEADTLSQMEREFIEKIRTVRREASRLGIPHVVFLTKVDCACELTKTSLQNVYKSKKITDKIKECSNLLIVPEDCIFPVQNYQKESDMNDDINCVMLHALTQIVQWANDYVGKY